MAGFALTGILSAFFINKYRKKEIDQGTYSTESFVILKSLSDKYTKKLLNSFFICVLVCSVLIISTYWMMINSKLLEVMHSNIIYLEAAFLLLIKNALIVRYLNKKIGKNKERLFTKAFKQVLIFSVAYWACIFFVCIFVKHSLMLSVFYIFAVIYAILCIVYNIVFRKKITYKNITANKKRIAAFGCAAFILVSYNFMQKDYWLLQPYINSVPDISEHNNQITYDRETGIYTIVNTDAKDFKILQLTDISSRRKYFLFRQRL